MRFVFVPLASSIQGCLLQKQPNERSRPVGGVLQGCLGGMARTDIGLISGLIALLLTAIPVIRHNSAKAPITKGINTLLQVSMSPVH